jgi:rhodanese-related sulfurtransferase
MAMPLEISAADSAALLKADPSVKLIDVRTDAEYMAARIDGALLVNNADSMAKVLAWPKETRILVHCHHGIRSLDAVAYLRERGFEQAQSVAGGIDAWSTRVDLTVPRY